MEAFTPNPDIAFPLEIRLSDGGCESYQDLRALEPDLEFFDLANDVGCEVRDANQRLVHLVVDRLQVMVLDFFENRGEEYFPQDENLHDHLAFQAAL